MTLLFLETTNNAFLCKWRFQMTFSWQFSHPPSQTLFPTGVFQDPFAIIHRLFLELKLSAVQVRNWRQKGTVKVFTPRRSCAAATLSEIFAVLRVHRFPGVHFSTLLLSDKDGILRYISSVESFKKYISNSIKTLPDVYELKQHFCS